MATRKTSQAPANPQVNNGDALDAWLNSIDMDSAKAKCSTAYTASMSRGYDDALEASQAFNITWDALAIWSPRTARVNGDKAEDRIRDLHQDTEPQSSTLALNRAKELLGHLSTACEEATVAHVRGPKAEGGLGRSILPVREKGKSQADGVAALQKIRAEALAAKDKVRVAACDAHLAAVGDVPAIVELCKAAVLLEAANSRFRRRIYLAKVAPMMDAAKVPHLYYEQVCGAAKAAHETCGKLDPQARTPARVQAVIETGVTKFIGENYGTAVKADNRTNAEKGMSAALAVLSNARRGHKYGVITDKALQNIIGWVVNDCGVIDPEAPKPPKAPKEPKAKKAKVVKPRQKKVVAPKEAPVTKRRVRQTPPPSAPIVSTTADDSVVAALAD